MISKLGMGFGIWEWDYLLSRVWVIMYSSWLLQRHAELGIALGRL
jgi:hypothetical protein